ncbi:unnamed protein product [Tilletia caries]|nr:unnamed protein product [Tilletia caries]CAD7065563.1 unnamed protein product [Tilletia caries]
MIAGSLPQYSAGAISPVPAQSLSSLADDGHMDMVSTDLVRTGVTFLLVYNYLAMFLFCLIAFVLMKNGLRVFSAKRFKPVFTVLGIAILMSLISSIMNSVFWASRLLHRSDRNSLDAFWLASITLVFLVPLVTQSALTIRIYALLPPMLASTRKRIMILACPVLLKVVRLIVLSVAMAHTYRNIRNHAGMPANALYTSSNWGFLMAELWFAFFDSLYASCFLLAVFLRSGRRNDSSLLVPSHGWLSGWLRLSLYACMFSFVVPTCFTFALAMAITLKVDEVVFGYLLIVNVILQNVGGLLATLSSQHRWRNSRFATSGMAHTPVTPNFARSIGGSGSAAGDMEGGGGAKASMAGWRSPAWTDGMQLATDSPRVSLWAMQGGVPVNPAFPAQSAHRHWTQRGHTRRPSFLRGPTSMDVFTATIGNLSRASGVDDEGAVERDTGDDDGDSSERRAYQRRSSEPQPEKRKVHANVGWPPSRTESFGKTSTGTQEDQCPDWSDGLSRTLSSPAVMRQPYGDGQYPRLVGVEPGRSAVAEEGPIAWKAGQSTAAALATYGRWITAGLSRRFDGGSYTGESEAPRSVIQRSASARVAQTRGSSRGVKNEVRPVFSLTSFTDSYAEGRRQLGHRTSKEQQQDVRLCRAGSPSASGAQTQRCACGRSIRGRDDSGRRSSSRASVSPRGRTVAVDFDLPNSKPSSTAVIPQLKSRVAPERRPPSITADGSGGEDEDSRRSFDMRGWADRDRRSSTSAIDSGVRTPTPKDLR